MTITEMWLYEGFSPGFDLLEIYVGDLELLHWIAGLTFDGKDISVVSGDVSGTGKSSISPGGGDISAPD